MATTIMMLTMVMTMTTMLMTMMTMAGIPKSKSTPGLVESSGKIPLEKMLLRNSRVCSQAKPTISLPFAVAPTGDTNEGVAAATFDDREAEAADQKSAFQSFSSFGERRSV